MFEQSLVNIDDKHKNHKVKQQLLKLTQKDLQKKGYSSDDRYSFMKNFFR